MDIQTAAASTLGVAIDSSRWPKEGPLSRCHVRGMLERIECGEITGEKAHRWLGWAQAACVAAGVATLDEMKQINHAA